MRRFSLHPSAHLRKYRFGFFTVVLEITGDRSDQLLAFILLLTKGERGKKNLF